jgi:DNA-3-methyladenine glycosylase
VTGSAAPRGAAVRRSGTSLARRAVRRSPHGAVLARAFFDRDTELVARELLGAVLECETADGLASGRIVETEAYLGEHDAACHAVVGETARTRALYGPPGTAYVYFIYGMYWCFNAVTRAAGLPSAVLVRALEPLDGVDLMRRRRRRPRHERDLANGPGKLCQALGIDGRLNGVSLDAASPLRIRRGEPVADARVVVTPRIGITRAADWPLRWLVRDSAYVSKTPPRFASRPLVAGSR